MLCVSVEAGIGNSKISISSSTLLPDLLSEHTIEATKSSVFSLQYSLNVCPTNAILRAKNKQWNF